MVTQVRGEEDVGSGIARGAKQAVAGAAGDGDGLDGGVEVSSDEEAGCGIRKCNGDGSGEVAQPCGVLEPADASNSLGGIIRAGLQRRSAEQSDGGGEGRGHASVSGVESGVGVRQGDAGANEAVNAPALG